MKRCNNVTKQRKWLEKKYEPIFLKLKCILVDRIQFEERNEIFEKNTKNEQLKIPTLIILFAILSTTVIKNAICHQFDA